MRDIHATRATGVGNMRDINTTKIKNVELGTVK